MLPWREQVNLLILPMGNLRSGAIHACVPIRTSNSHAKQPLDDFAPAVSSSIPSARPIESLPRRLTIPAASVVQAVQSNEVYLLPSSQVREPMFGRQQISAIRQASIRGMKEESTGRQRPRYRTDLLMEGRFSCVPNTLDGSAGGRS